MQTNQIGTLSLLLGTLCFYPPQTSAATGELWETNSSMESNAYGRMDMGTQRECRAATWRDSPEFRVPDNKGECKSQRAQRQGNGYVWKFDCGATKGEAIARLTDSDHLEGSMHMQSAEGQFTLKFSSRKIGSCEVGSRSR